ncbi:MAG: M20 family peptidase [Sneathiella sp.]|nr:M20 family peptidase [Sneathiella sp.]
MIKKAILLLVVIIAALAAVMTFKTVTNTPIITTEKPVTLAKINLPAATMRLSKAVQIKTISASLDAPVAASAFNDLHALIDKSFPMIAKNLRKEVIGGHSLLYTWQGSDPSLKPAMLMGHMDVVPVEMGTENKWQHPPFSGKIADGAVWGRGTLDDKLSVFAILEAAEHQLNQGLKPKRTLLFAFGHDEEILGDNGAGMIADHLKQQGVKLAFTLDEGMVVLEGIMPGIEKPIALIALAEKGFLTLELTATATGGHSSLPPKATAVGKIAKAIVDLEQNRLPASLQSPASEMLETLAPYMPTPLKAVISNRWLLDPILVSQLAKSKTTNAMVRTTTAATIVSGGTKDNVLPSTAKATVNFRILPGSNIDEVVKHVEDTINNPDVSITIKQGNNPSRVSNSDSKNYAIVAKTIREVFPEVIIAPGLMLAGSDSKHYESIAEDNYRFVPLRFGPEDLSRVHGTNERILIDNYREIIQFYSRLMENSGG